MTAAGKAWCVRLTFAMLLALWVSPAGAVGKDGDGVCKGAEVGAPCERDGDKCTLETCDAKGKCVADGPAVTCPGPMGQCDGGKTCDPKTGTCKDARDKPEGTSCELDQDKCTPDACNGDGFCVPAGPPVTCHGPGQCDGGKTCDPETGSCVNLPEVPEGTPCEVDRNKCTTDACNGKGYCVKGPLKTCDDGEVCTDDTCDPKDGACSNVEDPTNDPICVPNPDLAVDKKANCRCDDAEGIDDPGDDVVICNGTTGCKISYEITLTNGTLSDATGVQVADALPAAVTFLTSTASQGEYSSATTIWDVGDVAGGASATLTIEVEVGGSSPDGAIVDPIQNCANVAALDQTDPNAENDSDCVDVVGGDDPECPVPHALARCLERTSRLLMKAGQTDSAKRAGKLVRKAERSIARARRGVVRLNRAGGVDPGCLERLDARVRALSARTLGLAS